MTADTTQVTMDPRSLQPIEKAPDSSSSLSDAPSPDTLTSDFQSRGSSLESTNNASTEKARDQQTSSSDPNGSSVRTSQIIPHGWDTTTLPGPQPLAAASAGTSPQLLQQTPSATPRGTGVKINVGSVHSEITKGNLKADEDISRASMRGRGRGGRPKGRGRGGKSSKRKREDEEDDDDSDSSEVVTPVTTVTKSGRSILKPTSFVPPPHSPPTATKRKRPFRQRNAENAVCKTCLRGSSPASNMIVFCDGCNSPYHRYCHRPPIDQAVVDEVDKEWHCRHCRVEDAVPAPVVKSPEFVSVEGVTLEQKQQYFSSLPSNMLVDLLMRAMTLRPDLPLFTPEFKAAVDSHKTSTAPGIVAAESVPHPAPPSYPPVQSSADVAKLSSQGAGHRTHGSESDEKELSDDDSPTHPAHYPAPGQGLMSTLKDRHDLQWLVDPDDAKNGVYTHVYRTPHNGMVPATPPVRG